MKTLKNEKGYAMVMVILLVLVFTTLGMGLLTMNMSAAKQFNKKEEQVQARHLAEMGLLHYQARVNDTVEKYKFNATKTGAETAISKSRVELCNQIRAIGTIEQTQAKGSYKIPTVGLNKCLTNDIGKITITIYSTGKTANGITKLVEGSIEVAPPTIQVSDNPVTGPAIPSRPVNNTGQPPINSYPTTGAVRGFVEINGPFTINRKAYNFESFIINSSSTSVNALLNTGGNNDDSLKVEKDLYIAGGIQSNNHFCIYVQGNLTVLGNIEVGPHSLILVYGDAYFRGNIIGKSRESIHVIGNTYVGELKTITKDYEKFNGYTNKCLKDVTWPAPEEVAQIGKEYKWLIDTKLNTIYH